MQPHVENLNIDTEAIADFKIPHIPPWKQNCAEYRFDLATNKKSDTDRTTFQSKYAELKQHYYSFKPIYTDGSKDGNAVGSAAVYGDRMSPSKQILHFLG